ILASPRPGRGMAHLLVTRSAGGCPAGAQPVKALRYPCVAKTLISSSGNFPLSPRPLRRLTELLLRASLGDAVQSGIDSVDRTLIGLLRHSKRFFGPVEHGVFPYAAVNFLSQRGSRWL